MTLQNALKRTLKKCCNLPQSNRQEKASVTAIQNNSSVDQQHELCVVKATEQDIAAIQKLLTHYASLGDLLPRTRSDITKNLQHFRLIKHNEEVLACGSLENFTDELAEIRSLMVAKTMKGKGLGGILVEDLIQLAETRNVKRLMALTYVPGFFHKMGFKTVDKNIFPEKLQGYILYTAVSSMYW